MKKETYTFIIGLGIGYSVNKFMNKQVSDIQSAMIDGIKRKISDGFFKLLWCQTPEQYCESREAYRKRVNYAKDHGLREWKHKVDYRKIGKNDINKEKKKEFLDEISLYFCDNDQDEEFIRELFEEVFEK